MTKTLAVLIIGLVALGLTAPPAVAAPVSFFPSEVNLLSDNSAEYLINGPFSTGVTTLDVTDRLRGIFTVKTIEGLSSGSQVTLGSGTSFNELTGAFDVTVVSKSAVGGGLFTYAFAPTPVGTSSFAGFGAPAGTAVVVFEDLANNFSRVFDATTPGPDDGAPDVGVGPFVSEEALLARATDGTFRLALGFGGDPDELWICAGCVGDVAIAKITAPPGSAGAVNIQLSILANPWGVGFGQVASTFTGVGGDGLIDVNGSSSVLGTGGASTPFDVFDEVNFAVSVLPQPASVLLIGVGLLALASAVRWRGGASR